MEDADGLVTYVECLEDEEEGLVEERKRYIRERANEQLALVKSIQLEEFLHRYAHTAGEREITFYPATEEFDLDDEVYCYRQLVALVPKGIGGRAIAIKEESAGRSHPCIVLQYRVLL